MMRVLGPVAALASLVCVLLIVRTITDWRADALRYRAAVAVPARPDTVWQRAAGRVDTVLRTYWRVRSGETRGPIGARGSHPVATVAPPADTLHAACDELADACAAFRVAADDRARADSARLVAAHVVAARSLDSARRVLRDTVRALRRPWWRPSVTVGAACVAMQTITCGPSVGLGWRIGR